MQNKSYASLKEQYQSMHESGFFPGRSLLIYVQLIKECVDEYKPESLLDFGCGKGLQYHEDKAHESWGIMPTLYDPYFPQNNHKPSQLFDGVICTDVLEHVPEEDVQSTLIEIFSYAKKFAFLAISTEKAVKTLPDGRNCHLTVKDPSWWNWQIKKVLGGKEIDVKTVYPQELLNKGPTS